METDKTEAFVIDTEQKANWLLSKLAAIDAEKTRIKAQTEQRLRELDADRESLLFRFSADLERWAKEESLRRRRQTITLQQGTLAFRAVPSRVSIGELSDAITTAKIVCPSAVTVETVERFDRKAFLDHAQTILETTGEMLPGTLRTEAKESFTIKFPGAKDASE